MTDRLSPKRVAHLLEMRPEFTEAQAQAWYAKMAPKMRALGYKQLARAAVNWWHRADEAEIRACSAEPKAQPEPTYKAAIKASRAAVEATSAEERAEMVAASKAERAKW